MEMRRLKRLYWSDWVSIPVHYFEEEDVWMNAIGRVVTRRKP